VKLEWSSALLLDDTGAVSFSQMIEQSGLSEAELRALVDCGALAPREPRAPAWTFSARCVVTARTARRLRDDFALEDPDAVALVVQFAQRIEALERELRRLRALL
jgi:chaperone modulatory protein CbpM